ncbi:UNVERIFIED_CONTAM: hypothetical protein GTU68_045793 [Idotea baltica]|nr:hypothetical protein [Idotea baltica]
MMINPGQNIAPSVAQIVKNGIFNSPKSDSENSKPDNLSPQKLETKLEKAAPPKVSPKDEPKDTNNNDSKGTPKRGGDGPHKSRKYGLRPRTELRKPSYDCDEEDKEIPVEVVRRPRGHNRGNLMSKYRRRTANARERHRMREINTAFSTLRGILPPLSNRRTSQVSMTKIRTLRLAASYIQALSDLLEETEGGLDVNLQHYSDSLLQKIQASSSNFHSSCNYKSKRTSKTFSPNNDTKDEFDDFDDLDDLDSDEKFFQFERIQIRKQDSISDSENSSSKNSWDVTRPNPSENDLMSLLEDDSQQGTETDGNLNSWVDYKALDDLYFALN